MIMQSKTSFVLTVKGNRRSPCQASTEVFNLKQIYAQFSSDLKLATILPDVTLAYEEGQRFLAHKVILYKSSINIERKQGAQRRILIL